MTKGSFLLTGDLDLGWNGLSRSLTASVSSVCELVELELSSADTDGASVASAALICLPCSLGDFGLMMKRCFIPS